MSPSGQILDPQVSGLNSEGTKGTGDVRFFLHQRIVLTKARHLSHFYDIEPNSYPSLIKRGHRAEFVFIVYIFSVGYAHSRGGCCYITFTLIDRDTDTDIDFELNDVLRSVV